MKKTIIRIMSCCALLSVMPFSYANQTLQENRIEPNTAEQFKSILSEAKLQISDPKGKIGNITNAAKAGKYAGVMNEHFYVDSTDKTLVFSMSGLRMRSELRFMDNFKTGLDDTFYHLSATLKPVKPDLSISKSDYKLNEITYMQVHNSTVLSDGKSQFPHPLLRIVWKKERWGIHNHYWATVKSNTLICKGVDATPDNPDCNSKESYSFYDLGPWKADKKVHFEIIVGGQRLIVKRDGETKVNKNISYWDDQTSYFKAGVYNQFSNGTSKTKFYDLKYWIEKRD
ncbi:MAG: polysaccharide lyase family 7 protein [Vibrio sp.]